MFLHQNSLLSIEYFQIRPGSIVYKVDKINSAQLFQPNDKRDIRVLFAGPRWKFTLSYVDDGPPGVFPL